VKFLPRLLPKTLFVRLLLLMVAVIVLAQTATWFTFRAERAQLVARQFSETKIAQIQGLRAALANVPRAQRFGAISQLGKEYGVVIIPVDRRPEIGQPPRGPRILEVVDQLRKEFGADTEIRQGSREGSPIIYLRLAGADQAFWVGVPVERATEGFPWRLSLLITGLIAALMAIAYAFARRAARPLKELAAAAAVIGRGQTPARIDETGPAEISAVAKGFNQMRDDLTKVEEERAVMLAGVSHDIRTPLTRLKLELEMSGVDAKAKSAMLIDLEEIERTVGQFMEFAKTTADLPKVALRIEDWLPERIERERARRDGAPLTYHAEPTRVFNGHMASLDRAVTNLIDNAFRYGSESVDVIVGPTPEGAIRIDVCDRGPGIPPEEAEHLLRPFTRGNAARSDATGAGLGLAIVARIASLHAGTLTLLPREGGGTIARLSIATTR
jgi:two-component system, OmpR family, osmolarity sensor histidine kinase EnvZ